MSHWHIGFAVCEAVYLTLVVVVVVVVVVVSHYAFSNFLSSRRLLFLAFHSLDGLASLKHLHLMDIAFVITREHTESATICFIPKVNL